MIFFKSACGEQDIVLLQLQLGIHVCACVHALCLCVLQDLSGP